LLYFGSIQALRFSSFTFLAARYKVLFDFDLLDSELVVHLATVALAILSLSAAYSWFLRSPAAGLPIREDVVFVLRLFSALRNFLIADSSAKSAAAHLFLRCSFALNFSHISVPHLVDQNANLRSF